MAEPLVRVCMSLSKEFKFKRTNYDPAGLIILVDNEKKEKFNHYKDLEQRIHLNFKV